MPPTRIASCLLLLFLASSAAFCVDESPAARIRPNIVLILSDDQGYADVSCYDHPDEVSTPGIDRIAQAGVRFTNGYASAYVCAPTRAGLLTGRYQQRFGFYTASDSRVGLPRTETTIADVLRKEGYATGVFGKWHLGLTREFHPLSRGFDEFYGFLGHGAHDYFELRKTDDHQSMYRGRERIDDEGYLTDNLARESVSFIRRHRERPFFLYLPFNAVHWPLQAPKEDISRFGTGNKNRDVYLAMLHRMDRAVGNVLDALEESGVAQNTMVFFLSDNGGSKKVHANNGALRDFKQSVHEGGIRVPFLASWPGRLPAGKVCDEPVISLDLFPTICSAVGIEPAAGRVLDGRDLLGLFSKSGAPAPLHERLFWDGDAGKRVVRAGKWKLVDHQGRVQLYDLRRDIGEKSDVAAKHPDVVRRLRSDFDRWRKDMAPRIQKPKRRRTREERRARRQRKTEETLETPDTRPLNVLFIVCDDLNTRVSTSGYPHIRTPSFDRLAAEGMRFTRAYCQYPVCGPSRASFLSGLYPESSGVLDNKTDIRDRSPGRVSLPQLFKQGGFWTGGVGKVFHGRLDHGDLAWDEYHKFDNDWNPVVERARREFEAENGSIEERSNRKAWRAKLRSIRKAAGGQTPPGFGPTDMTDGQHRDGKNVRQIVDWLDKGASGDKPFFVACGIHKPHVPFLAPKKYFEMYPRDELHLPAYPSDDWDDIPALAMVKRYRAFGFELGKENPELRRDYTQAYHACISFVDAQIGMLFDSLKRNGLWDRTIVVLTSDHGYHLGEHFLWGKVTLFEECARVPLVVRVPGKTRAGTTAPGLVELVDLYPTLAELCGIELPEAIQGRSFVPILEDPTRTTRDDVYTVVTRGQKIGRSIRTKRWRYAEWGSGGETELYDLDADRRELTNLATRPELRERVAQMARRLGEARRRATR